MTSLERIHELMDMKPREYLNEIDKLSIEDLRQVANFAYGLSIANRSKFKDKSITIWQRVMRD